MRTQFELTAALVAFSALVQAIPTPQEAMPELPVAPAVTADPATKSPPTSTGSATSGGSTGAAGTPKQYDCTFLQSNGDPSAFPDPSKWLSADEIWSLWESKARDNNKDQFDDIESGIKLIKEALVDYPSSLGLPELQGIPGSVFVAKAAQESTMRVNPPCTNAGTTNCGILQGPQGSAKWEKSRPDSLKEVIKDAIEGKNDSGGGYKDGFQAALQKAATLGGDSVGAKVAIATRLYNSGLNELDGKKPINLNVVTGGSTPSYVSDMANLLTGWVNDGQHGSFEKCGGQAGPAANVVAGRR
ncbi:Hypothetical protein D9617_8g051650 [Elsinoe fawcettii]|nr:Hypothetical protein D9617_8g051650 [Elsinoe fawcettii]